MDELRRAKATTVVKLEKEYVNTSLPGFVYFYFSISIFIKIFLHRANRPERTKPCEKCEEYERMLENERKTSAQLKKLIDQKDKQQSTGSSGPCTKCLDLKKLLDIEKQNTQELTQQLKLEKRQTEEERNAKEVL